MVLLRSSIHKRMPLIPPCVDPHLGPHSGSHLGIDYRNQDSRQPGLVSNSCITPKLVGLTWVHFGRNNPATHIDRLTRQTYRYPGLCVGVVCDLLMFPKVTYCTRLTKGLLEARQIYKYYWVFTHLGLASQPWTSHPVKMGRNINCIIYFIRIYTKGGRTARTKMILEPGFDPQAHS